MNILSKPLRFKRSKQNFVYRLLTLFSVTTLLTTNFSYLAHATPLPPPPPPLPTSSNPPWMNKSADKSPRQQVIELKEIRGDDPSPNEDAKRVDARPLAPERLRELEALLPPLKKVAVQKFEPIASAPKVTPQTPVNIFEFPPKQSSIRSTSIPSTSIPKPATSALTSTPALKVSRVNRQGVVDGAVNSVAVTFSQPMVPITDIGSTSKIQPVILTPSTSGHWQWIDAKTIEFTTSAKRFPGATKFKVQVAAGTRSVSGGRLDQAATQMFETPTLSVEDFDTQNSEGTHGTAISLSPFMLVRFNQKVRAAQILPYLRLTVGKTNFPLRLATTAEAPLYHDLLQSYKYDKETCVIFKSTQSLPKNSKVVVTALVGAPSTEGPLRSVEVKTFEFNTFAPLVTLEKSLSAFIDNSVSLEFNSLLAKNSQSAAMISVTPRPKHFSVESYARDFTIHGDFEFGVNYTVRISDKLRDEFNQELSGPRIISLRRVKLPAQFFAPSAKIGIVAPGPKAAYHIYSFNQPYINVSVYECKPDQWEKYLNISSGIYGSHSSIEKLFASFKRIYFKKSTMSAAKFDQWNDTTIDLESLAKSGARHFIVVADGPRHPKGSLNCTSQWIDYSPVRATAFGDSTKIVVATSDIVTGKPLPNVKVTTLNGQDQAETDAHGICQIPLRNDGERGVQCRFEDYSTLVVGGDLVSREFWSHSAGAGQYLVYQNTDRNIYRPGERVRATGVFRMRDFAHGALLSSAPGLNSLDYVVTSYGAHEIAKGSVKLDGNGVFSFAFDIPNQVDLGWAEIKVSPPNEKFKNIDSTSFSIQDFRRSEFEVGLTSGQEQLTVGDSVRLTATGTYRSGSPLPHAKVHWTATSIDSAPITPNRYRDYTFCDNLSLIGSSSLINDVSAEIDGVAKADGTDTLQLTAKSIGINQLVKIAVRATVQDLNRQEWTAETNLNLHPADVYVGVETKSQFEKIGKKSFKVIVVDQKLELQPGYKVGLQLIKMRPKESDSSPVTGIVKQEMEVISEAAPLLREFELTEPGLYVVRAKTLDKKQREAFTQFYVDVLDGQSEVASAPPIPDETEPVDRIQPDKNLYRPGDVAKFSLKTNLRSGHGIALVKQATILDTVPFDFDNKTANVQIPIRDTYFGKVDIEIALAGPDNGTDSATGVLQCDETRAALNMKVSTDSERYQPGNSVHMSFAVKDSFDKPAGDAQIAVAVVDESVLALTNYTWPDLTSSFFRGIAYLGDPALSSSLLSVLKKELPRPSTFGTVERGDDASLPSPSALPPPPPPRAPGYSGGMVPPPPAVTAGREKRQEPESADSASSQAVSVRSDLNPLAFYRADIVTNADGTATVDFKLPGNLTNYKVMAVTVKGGHQFGNGGASFQANLPLMLRPSLPRFLNYKDHCKLPFIVQNTSSEPMNAELIVRANGLHDADRVTTETESTNVSSTQVSPEVVSAAIEQSSLSSIDYVTGRSFQIPANDRVEILLPVVADRLGGSVEIQAAVISGKASDAATLSFPVQPPVTAESVATYGQIDSGAEAQRIVVPQHVLSKVGGLEITTSSTAMNQLFDAAQYLIDYPHQCSEQLSSQSLGLGATADLAKQFKTNFDAKSSDITALQAKDVTELCGRQQEDGGFGLWQRDEREKYPFASIQCARALWLASQHGISVPPEVMEHSKKYLQNVEKYIPTYYKGQERLALSAYALNVRASMHDLDLNKAKKLIAEAVSSYRKSQTAKLGKGEALPIIGLQEALPRVMTKETMAWLLPVLTAGGDKSTDETRSITNVLLNHVDETASTAAIDTYNGNFYLMYYSPDRLNAVLLQSLIASDPKNDLIPKLAKGLLLSRRNGRWSSTQENAYSLLALTDYFATYEKDDPNFVADFWLGEAISFQQKFEGRSTTSNEMKIPMEYLQAHLKDDLLTLAKNGVGRLYYRIGMKYAPDDFKVPSLERGFKVDRKYAPVDAKADVTRDKDGNWHVRAGSTIRVTVKFSAPGTRYHVAMTDPLPAGVESINPELEGSRKIDNEAAIGIDDSAADDTVSKNEPVMPRWISRWFDHQNFRDSQTDAYTTLLPNGEYEFSYLVHATTPGTFVVPPCKVEEMYAPETFGRTETQFMVVE